MRTRALLVLTAACLWPVRAYAQEAGAPAPPYACCETWMPSGSYANCVTSATASCGAADPIAVPITYTASPLAEGQCANGFYDCQITTEARCCYDDCAANAAVCAADAPKPRPSCCGGECLGQPQTPQPLDPSCESPHLWGCCSPTGIVRGPNSGGESPEWAISFGYEIGGPGPDAGVEGGTGEAPSGHHGGCSVGAAEPAAAGGLWSAALALVLARRRRLLRDPLS